MRVLSIVGARPQFVKLSPVDRALAAAGHEHIIVHTGQHYDHSMSEVFFNDLGIAEPDLHLDIGSASHGAQTGRILEAMDAVLVDQNPDWVVVYGDTNSTMAGALAAVKLHYPLAHLEAGLRSFNRRMPEEHNRVLTDHAADLCLAPTQNAMVHLFNEGLAERSKLVGDVMTDVCLSIARLSARSTRELPGGVKDDEFILATVHRAENTDDPDRLRDIIGSLEALVEPVLLAAHPRLITRCQQFGIELERGPLILVSPLDYPTMMHTIQAARAVVTDSGGLQKEAFLLRTPCTTIRQETEWTETVELGWNVLAHDLRDLGIHVSRDRPSATDASPYGDGHAAEAVVQTLESWSPLSAA